MALVYVHGIGNRRGDAYAEATDVRDGLFRTLFLPTVFPGNQDALIINPYWGDHGGKPRWDLASVDLATVERLGAGPGVTAEIVAAGAASSTGADAVLLAIARISLRDAVDALYSIVTADQASLPELIAFAGRAVKYCRTSENLAPYRSEVERHPWLLRVRDDLSLIDHLIKVTTEDEDTTVEILGGASALRNRFASAVSALKRAAVANVTEPAVTAVRRRLGDRFAAFFGDITGYLAQRGTKDEPGPIPAVVADAIEQAADVDEPVVVVAHSMGGNIVHDLLTHFRADLRVDVLVTVGSQVGLFEELKLFHASDPAITGDNGGRALTPAGVGHWINVVDIADPLSFRVGPVFDRAVDYVYASGAVWAHTAYLRQPNFHERLARKIVEVLG
ncbi:esterase/lipase family protein [Kibdelosporangium aridum]|uniref:esterase/lipase family protein n=1 Tax=Kibdelosporangium aridum TaxID=2030 RepID=UPI000526A558